MRERPIFLIIRDLVFYSGPSVGDVGGGGVGFLVRLCVRAAICLYSLLMLL